MIAFSHTAATQNCYVRLDDASGYTPTAGQLAALEAAACRLIDSLPAAFQDSFKVYDFGFYLHNETQQGGYPEAFQWAIDTVQGLSPYYLLFGKQTDRSGVYTRFWVELRLPETGAFACMKSIQREYYKGRINEKVKVSYNNSNNIYFTFSIAELAGINEVIEIILEIKDCCLSRPGYRLISCNHCENNLIESYFRYSGFKIIELETSVSSISDLKNDLVLDYSNINISIGGIEDFTGTHLQSELNIINQLLPIKLLVTSNLTFCNVELDSIKSYYLSDNTFVSWIHFGEDNAVYIRVFYNGDSEYLDFETPNIINDIYCTFYKLINYEDQKCQELANFQGDASPIFLNPVFQDYTSTGPFAKYYYSKIKSYKSFIYLLRIKRNYTIYLFPFNIGSIRFNGETDDPIEMMDASSSKGQVNIFNSFGDFKTAKSNAGSNDVISDINDEEAAEIFQQGKPVIFVGIADQLLFPLKNLQSGQSSDNPETYKVINLAILQISETIMHELLAHVEKKLNGDLAINAIEDHQQYHGKATATSPSAAQILTDYESYKNTRAYKVAREIYEEMKKENRIIPNLN